MSGWTILTVRGRPAGDYEFTEHDGPDRWQATADIAATMDADNRVHKWAAWKGHVYAYLNCSRYNFSFAERMLAQYEPMVDDAVVLGANDTSDTGTARYYPDPTSDHVYEYEETQAEDGTFVGEMALCVINSKHGIIARDPFHNRARLTDEMYLDAGQNHADRGE